MLTVEKILLEDMAKLSYYSYLSQSMINNIYIHRPYNKYTDEGVFYNCNLCPQLYQNKYDSQVLITKYKKKLCVIFRGTDSSEDIEKDLMVSKKPLKLTNNNIIPKVHYGFLLQFNSLKKNLNKEIKNYISNEIENEPEIIFTGHSLGGALATIASLFYKDMYPKININCITFGSPRVGDNIFSNLFDKLIQNSVRIINNNDPIPCVPTSLRFKHVKGVLWLNNHKMDTYGLWNSVKLYIMNVFGYGYDVLDDHKCRNYKSSINKYITNQ